MQPNDFTNYDDGKSSFEENKPIKPEVKEPAKPVYSTQPEYQTIIAEYVTKDDAPKQESSNYFDPNGLVLYGIKQGIPVTNADVDEIRHAARNRSAMNMEMNYRRKIQSFICLNVFYSVVLVISLNSNFSDYREFKIICPNYAKSSLLIGIIGISWMAISLLGIYAAVQKLEKAMKAYQFGLMTIILVTVIVVGFGLINKDESPFCDSDPPKNVTLIGLGIFTIIIVALFAFTASKMRQLIGLLPRQQQNQQRARNPNPQIEAQALAPIPVNQGVPLHANVLQIEE